MYAILFLCLISCNVLVIVDSAKTQCCLCDDFTVDNKCTETDCYDLCDVCETRRTFREEMWYTTKTCANETTCAIDIHQTSVTPACTNVGHGAPIDGTACYTCCQNADLFDPDFCLTYTGNHGIFEMPSTVTTTTQTTTPTTTTPTTTPATTTTPTKATTTTPAITTRPPVSCETCLSGNCSNPRTLQCGEGENYCMNTLTYDGTTTTVKKACATQMECYYNSYVAMKQKSECAGAAGSTGNQSYTCYYCCDAQSGQSACNTDTIPQQQAVFDQTGSPGTGTVCEVGRDTNYKTTMCHGLTPFCMNTIILQTHVNITKKTCESEILCNQDWWELTRNREKCMMANSTMLPVTEDGLVCHYCCLSRDGQPCNTDLIPMDTQAVIAKSVDGGWSEWSKWRGCSEYCTGISNRFRSCDNPVPGIYGNNCHGPIAEQEECSPNKHCNMNVTGSQALIG